MDVGRAAREPPFRIVGGGSLRRVAVTLAAPIHRLSYDDVMRMVEAGVLDENARVELLDGVLVDLNPTGPYHDGLVARLTKRFVRALPEEYELRPQLQFNLPGGDFVVPDLMVVDPALGVDRQPTTASLVIEIAHTSQRHDRDKAARYAAAGVEEYWIADIVARLVLVHRDPGPHGYATVTEHREGVLVPLIGTPEVPVAELLG